jgi:hypothetical protein
MPNRNLDEEELKLANSLLSEIRRKIDVLARGDSLLRFAYRRKISKELIYDERGKPMDCRKVKIQKHDQQSGRCAHCHLELKIGYSELDRKIAADGYTLENTEFVHAECHRRARPLNGTRRIGAQKISSAANAPNATLFPFVPKAGCRTAAAYLSVSASTPGSFLPSRNSSDAPPPVEIWVIWSATPA